jgi:Zn-finger protein
MQVAPVLRWAVIFNNFCKYWPNTAAPANHAVCFCDFFLARFLPPSLGADRLDEEAARRSAA